jgi:CMP-N-acetylneuraminic acid synthetase
MPVYAVVPARAGSKGIPGKNLYRLRGTTLLERAIRLGQSCSRVDRVVVSTDDQAMNEIAGHYGAAMPALRPAHLATDTALAADVLAHVIEQFKIRNALILLLQTTSPLRTRADLEALLDAFEAQSSTAEAIVSLARQEDPHPEKVQRIQDGYVRPYFFGQGGAPRQTLPEAYRFNGAFYLVRSEVVMKQRTLLPARTLAFVMPAERSINLDSPLDLVLLEAVVERGIAAVEDC